jgi:hypothetical protein
MCAIGRNNSMKAPAVASDDPKRGSFYWFVGILMLPIPIDVLA